MFEPKLATTERAGRTRDPQEDASYTKQFFDIAEQGHTRPTPRLGAPCTHWHLAVWPTTRYDPNHHEDQTNLLRPGHDDDVAEHLDDIRQGKLRHIARGINALISKLKSRGAIQSENGAPAQVNLKQSSLLPEGRQEFDVVSIGFTLWWNGGTTPQKGLKTGERPDKSAIRVRTQIELYEEFFTVSFFMDIGKPWNQPPAFRAATASSRTLGTARVELMEHVETIQAICEPKERRAVTQQDLIPETCIDDRAAEALLAASNRLYEGVWDDFCSAFDLSLLDVHGDHGWVFANFRGLVLPTAGMGEQPLSEEALRTTEAPGVSVGDDLNSDWLARFSPSGAEANAVIKSYWPFIRRMSFGADYRDWIACTVFSRRSVFVTSLGSPSLLDGEEENSVEHDVKAQHTMPRPHRRTLGESYPPLAPRSVYGDRPGPFRELYVTKYQPHPTQLGRMLERFNTLGTLRLYALKNAAVIKDAGNQVRAYGQELNAIMGTWFEDINNLQLEKAQLPKNDDDYDRDARKRKSTLDEQIANKNAEAEQQLVDLSIRLNKLGHRSTGGLEYRINRSRRHSHQFRRFVDTMAIEEVDTWLSYREFAHFGLSGAFEEIDRVGQRVDGLRNRLLSSMASIQTGAIAGQTEATRDNTYHLERISDELTELARVASRLHLTASIMGLLLAAFVFFTGIQTFPEALEFWRENVLVTVPTTAAE